MKHFLSFFLALCTIVIAAVHLTPSYEGQNFKPDQGNHFNFDVGLPVQNAVVLVTPVSFSPGILPDPIEVPRFRVKYKYMKTISDKDRSLENKILNESVYKETTPNHSI